MFVIIQCRNTLSEADKSKDVVERLGVTLRHAGVAITITSITNFIAFGIGATTAMPALKSFCVYASIGILSIFFFQVGFIKILPWIHRLYLCVCRTPGSQHCSQWTSTDKRLVVTAASAACSTPPLSPAHQTCPASPVSGPPPSVCWPGCWSRHPPRSLSCWPPCPAWRAGYTALSTSIWSSSLSG